MRDLLLILVIFLVLPACVYRPWIGILSWAWISYMNPHRLTWTFAYDFPFAQLVALATLAGFAINLIRERRAFGYFNGIELKLLLVLWFVFSVTTVFALQPDDAWESWEQISKILLMTFLTIYLIDDERKLRYLLLVIAFSIGFYGFKGGIFSILGGGQYRVWGPAASFIEDNNALALALNMTLPIMHYLAQTEPRRWLRILLRVTFWLSVLSVVFTYSRGGFLGLAVVLFSLFVVTRLRNKVILAVIIVAAFPAAISQMPDAWMDRITSMGDYQQDGSAMSRLEAWKASWNLAVELPLTGGGFEALNDRDTYLKYNPGVVDKEIVHVSGVHSIYFELLAENGFPGLIVFIALCIAAIRSATRLIRNRDKENSEYSIAYGRMFRTSLLAYLVSGTFLELASFDLFYQIVALTVVSKRLFLTTPPIIDHAALVDL